MPKKVKQKEIYNAPSSGTKKAVLITVACAMVVAAGIGVGMYFFGKKNNEPEPAPVIKTFTVTHAIEDDNLIFSGNDTVEENATYTCTITPKDKLHNQTEIISIKMNNEKLVKNTDYTFVNYELKIEKPAIGNIVISAKAGLKTFNVRWSSPDCIVEGDETIGKDEQYTCKITTGEGKHVEIVGVSMEGLILPTDQYKFEGDTLNIIKATTGNIVIWAEGVNNDVTEFPVIIDCKECKAPQASRTVHVGDTYTCKIEPNDSNKRVVITSVIMNGTILGNNKYEYNLTTQQLKIKEKASGAIYIVASVEDLPVTSYSVKFNVDNCAVPAGAPDTSSAGSNYACAPFTVTDPDLIVRVFSITMGGKLLTSTGDNPDYSYDSTTGLKINVKTDGNIVISAIAQKDANVCGVSFNGTGCKTSDTQNKATKGQNYTCNIESLVADNRPIIRFVTMNGVPVELGGDNGYSFELQSGDSVGVFTIKNVTGDIIIIASTEPKTEGLNIYHTISECESISTARVTTGQEYSVEIKPTDPTNKKPIIVSVMMNGIVLTEGNAPTGQYKFEKDASDKYILTIYSGVINADVYITAIAIQKERAYYSVSYALLGILEPSSQPIELGSTTFECGLVLQGTEEETANKEIIVYKITEDGISLNPSDYSFSKATGKLTVAPKDADGGARAIEGDLVITATSKVRDKFAAAPIAHRAAGGGVIVDALVMDEGISKNDVETIEIPNKMNVSENNDGEEDVTEIGGGLLKDCGKLESISLPFVGTKKPESSTSLTSSFFGEIFGSILFSGVESLTWQELYATTSYDPIEGDVEDGHRIERYAVPSSLEKVTITSGDAVVQGAFSGCKNLRTVIYKNTANLKIGSYAFRGCKALSEFKYNNMISEVEWRSFEDCACLNSIDLSVATKIGHNAFYNCSNLHKVFLSKNVTEMGSNAFCNILSGIVLVEEDRDTVLAKPNWHSDWVDTYTSVIYSAGENPEIKIDSTGNFHFIVKTRTADTYNADNPAAFIGEYLGNPKAEVITIPETLMDPVTNDTYTVTDIGTYVFQGYSVTNKFVFNCSHLETIGNYTFSQCYKASQFTNLSQISSLVSIGYGAFAADFSLGDFSLAGTGIKEIPDSLFYKSRRVLSEDKQTVIYPGLTSIALPTGLTHIGVGAFEECSGLTSLALNVTGLDTVPNYLLYCEPDNPSVLTNFSWTSDTALHYIGECPSSSKETSLGSTFGGLTSLTDLDFSCNGTTYTTNQIPPTIRGIDNYSFIRCTALSIGGASQQRPSTKCFELVYNSTLSDRNNIYFGKDVFSGWQSKQYFYINSGWTIFQSGYSDGTTYWGWTLMHTTLYGLGDYYACSSSGSNVMQIYVP